MSHPATPVDDTVDDTEARCHRLPSGDTCTSAHLAYALRCRSCQKASTPPLRQPRHLRRSRPRR